MARERNYSSAPGVGTPQCLANSVEPADHGLSADAGNGFAEGFGLESASCMRIAASGRGQSTGGSVLRSSKRIRCDPVEQSSGRHGLGPRSLVASLFEACAIAVAPTPHMEIGGKRCRRIDLRGGWLSCVKIAAQRKEFINLPAATLRGAPWIRHWCGESSIEPSVMPRRCGKPAALSVLRWDFRGKFAESLSAFVNHVHCSPKWRCPLNFQ